MAMLTRGGAQSRLVGVLLLLLSTTAVAGEVAWGTPVKGLQFGLSIVPGSGLMPSELQLEVQVRNTASEQRLLPVAACGQMRWPTFVVLHLRTGGRVFRYHLGSFVDTADVHPHGPVPVAPGEVLRERVSLRDVLQNLEVRERDSALGALLLTPREVELWVELASEGGHFRLASGSLEHRFGLVSKGKPGGRCVIRLAVGGNAACALLGDGMPWCWGISPPGMNMGVEDNEVARPQPLRMLAGLVDMGMGGSMVCGRTPEGAVYCAGGGLAGYRGALTVTTGQPVRVQGLDGAVSLEIGTTEKCARTADGALMCWALMRPSLAPVQELIATRWEQLAPGPATVALGNLHGCAVRKDGTLWCWGNNEQGQLGTGNTTPQPMPVQLSHFPGEVASVAAGGYHTCAALKDGSLWCWGSSEYGALGLGPVHRSLVPARVEGMSEVVRLAAGYQKTCAWKKDGTFWCFGELLRGLGEQALVKVPVEMKELGTRVEEVAFGFRHTCARTTARQGAGAGDVVCWGENSAGQLGTEKPGEAMAPPIPSLKGKVQSLSAGDYFTCALTTDGAAWCWGSGYGGRLGTGRKDLEMSSRPLRVRLPCAGSP
jgi:hypothetical protein